MNKILYSGFGNSKPFLLTLFFLLSFSIVSAQNPKPFVIPSLQQWKGDNGSLKLDKGFQIILSESTPKAFLAFANTFAADIVALDSKFKNKVKIGKPTTGSIYFDINPNDTSLKEEAYILKIGNHLEVKASTVKGGFWATRTILQLLEQQVNHDSLPKGEAFDYPKYPVRGFVLDAGRKFFSIDFLRDYIKFMSYYKMNDFHIHLNDNGFKKFFNDKWDETYSAFRLENNTYPNLTAKDGSYSKKEFIELQELAQSYGVKIIPEIDIPAHSLAIVKAVPEIGSKKYGADHLDINNPLTYKVIDNIFKEYLEGPKPVFIGDEVHIGTDEYDKNEAESFRAFTDHYIKYVEGFGKKVRLWGALTHASGKTPVKSKDVTMNVWYNGYANPKDMLDLGYDVISTPDGWLYIVPAAGYYYDYLNNKKIYNEWTPNMIGNQTFDEHNTQIKGGSFAVWNDHPGNGITAKDVHDRVFASMQVLAQKMWTAKLTSLSFEDFSSKAKLIGEAPGLNIAAKVKGKDAMVLAYNLKDKSAKDVSGNSRNSILRKNLKVIETNGIKAISFQKNSFIESPLNEIGYNYTVSFHINVEPGNSENSILFSSPNATVKLKQGNTNKLGFSREGYDYNFDFVVPENIWTNIVITGNHKGTSLYVNGELKEKLEGTMQTFANTKDKNAKVQTLFFPIKYIGDKSNGFSGKLSDFKVFNQILSAEEIKKL